MFGKDFVPIQNGLQELKRLGFSSGKFADVCFSGDCFKAWALLGGICFFLGVLIKQFLVWKSRRFCGSGPVPSLFPEMWKPVVFCAFNSCRRLREMLRCCLKAHTKNLLNKPTNLANQTFQPAFLWSSAGQGRAFESPWKKRKKLKSWTQMRLNRLHTTSYIRCPPAPTSWGVYWTFLGTSKTTNEHRIWTLL